LNASATPTAVTALLRNLTYANLSENPSALPRTVQLTVTDGDGHTSNPVNKTINVTAVNDAPTLTGNAMLTAVTQNTTNPSGSSLSSLFSSLFNQYSGQNLSRF